MFAHYLTPCRHCFSYSPYHAAWLPIPIPTIWWPFSYLFLPLSVPSSLILFFSSWYYFFLQCHKSLHYCLAYIHHTYAPKLPKDFIACSLAIFHHIISILKPCLQPFILHWTLSSNLSKWVLSRLPPPFFFFADCTLGLKIGVFFLLSSVCLHTLSQHSSPEHSTQAPAKSTQKLKQLHHYRVLMDTTACICIACIICTHMSWATICSAVSPACALPIIQCWPISTPLFSLRWVQANASCGVCTHSLWFRARCEGLFGNFFMLWDTSQNIFSSKNYLMWKNVLFRNFFTCVKTFFSLW